MVNSQPLQSRQKIMVNNVKKYCNCNKHYNIMEISVNPEDDLVS